MSESKTSSELSLKMNKLNLRKIKIRHFQLFYCLSQTSRVWYQITMIFHGDYDPVVKIRVTLSLSRKSTVYRLISWSIFRIFIFAQLA